MVNKSLKNKKIIISAGASGIGLATTKVCLSRGAYVYLCDIDNKSLNKLNKHPLINKRLFKYNCDASDESKWAIIGITKTLAMELGKYNIRVNAVCPGSIKGERMKRVIRDKAKFTKVSSKKIEKDFISMSSMKKWILEEDIGKMCAFLISDDSSKVSGQVISVDGHTERND